MVIAYVNEDNQATKLVGSWVSNAQPNLNTSIMFALGCAVTATSAISLILACVIIFVYEPEIKLAQSRITENKTRHDKAQHDKTQHVKDTVYLKRQETKYHGKDEKERSPSKDDDRRRNDHMNGHVNMAYVKDPAVITKDKEDSKVS